MSFRSLAGLILLVIASAQDLPAETLNLAPDFGAWTAPVRVTVDLKVSGQVTPEAPKGGVAKPRRIQAQIGFAYRQEGVQPSPEGWPRVVRVADRAECLRNDRRVLIADGLPDGAVVSATGGALNRAELDAVQLPADPLDIDWLLPAHAIRKLGSWKVDPAAIQRVLRLDSVQACEVTGVAVDASERHAKIRFAGAANGMAEGAPVRVDVRGVALVDRRLARIVQLNLGWKESRDTGPATPALEATAKLNLKIELTAHNDRIAASDLLLAATTEPETRLEVIIGREPWRLLADRNWYVVANDQQAATLRHIEANKLAAVATLVPGPSRDLSINAFASEVRSSLGDQLSQVVATEQPPISNGVRQKVVISLGSDADRPVEWRHFHLAAADASLAVTTTLRADDGPADDASIRRLVDTAEPIRIDTAAVAGSMSR